LCGLGLLKGVLDRFTTIFLKLRYYPDAQVTVHLLSIDSAVRITP